MSEANEEIVKRLIEEDEEFRKVYQSHRDYDEQIKKFDKKAGLTPYEEIERKKLQKLKLHEKDRMEEFILNYRNTEESGGEERQG